MDPMKLFETKTLVNVCAPMVRYSKLEFRTLVRNYNCDLCFTPMIMADSFVQSQKARNNEFTTNLADSPLIVQFAATNAKDFVKSTELISPYSNGVDLNCGCPQRWAMKIGVGAQMMNKPEVIHDIVRQVKNKVKSGFTVSVKMRLLDDIGSSVVLCQQIEKAGADFVTIHGRTKDQRSEPINTEAIKTIIDSIQIPVIANGDVKSIIDAVELQALTGCKGVMSARSLLQNPAMFSGFSSTPETCVKQWISIALEANLHFLTFHHHLVFMLEKVLPRHLRNEFNNLKSYPTVVEFLNKFYGFDFKYIPVEIIKQGIWDEEIAQNKFFKEKTDPDINLNELFLSN